MNRIIVLLAVLTGYVAAAGVSLEPPLAQIYATNRTAAQLIAALDVMTNGTTTVQMPFSAWPTNDNGSIGNGVVALGGGQGYGLVFNQDMYVQSIRLLAAVNTSYTNGTYKIWSTTAGTWPTNFFTSPALVTGSIVYGQFAGIPSRSNNLVNLSVPNLFFPSNSQMTILFITSATNTVITATYMNDSNNTNFPRVAMPFLWDTGGTIRTYNLYAEASAEMQVSGYTLQPATSLTNAAALAYSGASSGLTANNVQSALDAVAAPFAASNTIVVLDGDSLTAGMGPKLLAKPWWSSTAVHTNVSVGGTGLSDMTNRWATNTYRFTPGPGTNGIYWCWIGANDLQWLTPSATYSISNAQVYCQQLSNHWAQVASSNFLIIGCTVMPKASPTYATTKISAAGVVNNFIRGNPMLWRVVDAAELFQNYWDTNYFLDGTHLQPWSYTNLADAIHFSVFGKRKTLPPRWSFQEGSNYVVMDPVSGQISQTLGAYGVQIATNTAAGFPPVAMTPGGIALVNSNGTLYLLSSPPNDTTWSATNIVQFTAGAGGNAPIATNAPDGFPLLSTNSTLNGAKVAVGTIPNSALNFTAPTNGSYATRWTMSFNTPNNTLAANLVRYWGGMGQGVKSSMGEVRQVAPWTGTITDITFAWEVEGTVGTINQATTNSLYVSGTLVPVSTNDLNTTSGKVSKHGLTQSVTAGDDLCIRLDTPATWSTPATSVYYTVTIGGTTTQ